MVYYQYKPLKGFRDIRLVEIAPGKEDEVLRGQMKHTSIDLAGRYHALSYEWGSSLKPYHIKTSDGLIALTGSLYNALRELRDTKETLVVWADAICIDQENDYEKVLQLRLMGEIFQTAESVSAWLGEEADGSDQAITTLLQIRTLSVNPKTWPEMLAKVPPSWEGQRCPRKNDDVWEKIDRLLERGFFSRIWILQEVVFASKITVHCGRWSLDWEDIFEAIKICTEENTRHLEAQVQSRNKQIPIAAYTLGITREIYRHQTHRGQAVDRRFSLLQLLELFAYTSATRERDKIFALLLLASDGQDPEFEPDYSSSWEKVVRRYANVFVQRGAARDLLYRAGTAKSFKFCSWIPDWIRGEAPTTISTWHSTKGSFSASGASTLSAEVSSKNDRLLVVRGSIVDRIAKVGDVTLEDHDVVAYVNYLRKEIDKLGSYPTGESLDELKFSIPIGQSSRPHLDPLAGAMTTFQALKNHQSYGKLPNEDAGGGRVQGEGDEDTFDPTGARLDIKSIQHLIDFLKQPQNLRDSVWKYWHTAAAFSKRLSVARFCTTEKGYAGLVPGDAKIGDEVFIANGTAVPFLVRHDDGKGRKEWKKLVGECYVHGIMFGEALAKGDAKDGDICLV